jgi:hypothetical protein
VLASSYRPSGRSARYLATNTRGFKGKRFVLPYSLDLDATRIHVQAASDVVFLCGGPYSDLSDPIPLSLRDVFLKIIDFEPLRKRVVINAEQITRQYSFFDYYSNILDFETDLAQIVELIILFSESEGSLAELGAFAMIDEIAQRLFVIVRQKYWDADPPSFIRLGPLRRIERKYGRESIHVLEDTDIGMRDGMAASVNKTALSDLLNKPLTLRINRPRDPTTLDARRSGHVIKLIVGLVQEYGALDASEIADLLRLLNSERTPSEIQGYLLCAEAVGWLKKLSKGSIDFFVAKKTSLDAATIPSKPSAQVKNKERRRLLIREYWKANDAPRHNGIAQVYGEIT